MKARTMKRTRVGRRVGTRVGLMGGLYRRAGAVVKEFMDHGAFSMADSSCCFPRGAWTGSMSACRWLERFSHSRGQPRITPGARGSGWGEQHPQEVP